MKNKTFLVTGYAPDCRDVVRDRVNGIPVPFRDSSATAEEFRALIENPEIRKQIGAKGRELVESDFSLEKVNSETLALYEGLKR